MRELYLRAGKSDPKEIPFREYRMKVVTILQGQPIQYEPLPGLDPSLGERALQLGATVYGMAKLAGKPEAIAHREAEQVMYETVFYIHYGGVTRKS